MPIKKVKETHHLGSDIEADFTIDLIDGEYADAMVSINGFFWIEGGKREDFVKNLKSLIDEYRI